MTDPEDYRPIVKFTIVFIAVAMTIVITITVMATNCNPAPETDRFADPNPKTLLQRVSSGECTWEYKGLEPRSPIYDPRD